MEFRRRGLVGLLAVLACLTRPGQAQRGWGARKKEASDFESLNEKAAVGGGDDAFLTDQMEAMSEKVKTVAMRMAVVVESRALEASPTKDTFVRLMRNDPVLNRDIEGWASAVDTELAPFLGMMPSDDADFAAGLPEIQKGFRELATSLSGSGGQDFLKSMQAMAEMTKDPEKLAQTMSAAMDEITSNPAYAAQMEQAIEAVTNPDFFNEMAASFKAMGHSDEQIAEMEKLFQDPGTQEAVKQMFQDPNAMKEMFNQMAGAAGGAGGFGQLPQGRRRGARADL